MIIDCISDLHGFFPKLDGGDLLIVAGDLVNRGEDWEYRKFIDCLKGYKKVIVIAGNHDEYLERCLLYDLPSPFSTDHKATVQYLCDSGTEFEGRTIWGSPWTPTFCEWHFMKERGADIKKQWDLIPDDIDILITHGPPHGILDECHDYDSGKINHTGCEELMHAVNRIRPKLHVFGHIHEGHGKLTQTYGQQPTIFVNASHVNDDYKPVNKPIRVIL